ncbi:oxygen-dependent tRNA uridine(34) hydroxylase TrhO [Tsuneonella sp. HG249]
MTNAEPTKSIQVAALYRFVRLTDCEQLRRSLQEACRRHGIKGTLLLASEGINGTIAGSEEGISNVLAHIRSLPDCSNLEVKYSVAATMPFHRMKVRIKREIVTLGQPGIDPVEGAGTYVEPADWNALIEEPGTVVIDTRNDYEVVIGSFAGAVDPQTATFRDFPAWFERERDRLLGSGKQPKIAMYCTGGIRCEKATAYLKREGVENVYHLKGGILAYLETIPAPLSRWQGECFVFDQRVSVGQGLADGTYGLCFACRQPISAADRQSPLYEPGASCPRCYHQRDEAQRASYRERHRQEERAKEQGRAHVGAVFEDAVPDGD